MKLSALPTETTFALSDLMVKIKAAAAGDAKVTLQDFITATGMWQELGRATAPGGASTLSIPSLVATKKYLRILIVSFGATNSNVLLTLNNDSAANYSRRTSDGGAADSTATAQNSIALGSSADATMHNSVVEIMGNIAAQEKLLQWKTVSSSTAGAGTAPARSEGSGKWANTAAAITRVDLATTSGNFSAGSEIIVLGRD